MVSSCFVLNKTLTLIRYVFTLIHHLYCYPSAFLWTILIWPLRWIRPDLFWCLYHPLMDLLNTMGNWYPWSVGYGVVEVGDDISPCYRDRCLVLVNHQSAVDILLMWTILMSRPHMLRNAMWILNEEFKYAPFGIVCAIRKDFFIPIGREKRAQGIVSFKEHLQNWYIPMQKKMLIIFPEGGFLRKRRAKSQKYALENGLPVLQNVCLPRLGAVQAAVDVCTAGALGSAISDDDQLKWILDVTIAYPDGIPLSFANLFNADRKPFNTSVLYRLFPASEVTGNTDQVGDWLYSRWQEKESILSKFYETGELPVNDFCSNPVPPRLVVQNPICHIFINLFFLLSSYGFYKIFSLFVTPDCTTILTLLTLYGVFLTLKVTKVI